MMPRSSWNSIIIIIIVIITQTRMLKFHRVSWEPPMRIILRGFFFGSLTAALEALWALVWEVRDDEGTSSSRAAQIWLLWTNKSWGHYFYRQRRVNTFHNPMCAWPTYADTDSTGFVYLESGQRHHPPLQSVSFRKCWSSALFSTISFSFIDLRFPCPGPCCLSLQRCDVCSSLNPSTTSRATSPG